MIFFLGMVFFLIGSFVGSFLNVVILRYNTGRGVVNSYSGCLSCGKRLQWFELVPILSFFLQRGRCRGCQTPISWQYPLVELMSGVLFLAVLWKFDFALTVWAEIGLVLVIFSILVVIGVYDIRHKIIPDGFVFTFIVLSFISLFMSGNTLFSWSVFSWGALWSGPLLFAPFALLWIISRGRWIGFGDAKFAWGMGWFLGGVLGFSALILAFWSGAVVAVMLLFISRFTRKSSTHRFLITMKSEVPFAPFLIISTILVYLFEWDVVGLSKLLAL